MRVPLCKAAKQLLILIFWLLGCGAGFGQTHCGLSDDGSTIVRPSNYSSFTPPALGTSYREEFGGSNACQIFRVTDGASIGQNDVVHNYSTATPFNSDDSLLMVFDLSGAPFIVRRTGGSAVVAVAKMPSSTNYVNLWSSSNPAAFYYGNSTALKKGVITGTNCDSAHNWSGAPCTITSTTLCTTPTGNLQFNEQDVSEDGLHVWIADQYQDQNTTTHLYLMTLNATDPTSCTVSATATLPNGYHKLVVLPNNMVFKNAGTADPAGDQIFNTDGTVFLNTFTAGGHVDFGRDLNGKVVGIAHWYQPPYAPSGTGVGQNPCINGYGAAVLMLQPGDPNFNKVVHCFSAVSGAQIGAGQVTDNHWSFRDTTGGWVIMETSATSRSCSPSDPSCFAWTGNAPTACAGTSAMSCWDHLQDEVLAIKIDFSQVLRLAHHRARVNGGGSGYWSQPRPSISRDGKYIAFDSNYDISTGSATEGTLNVFVIPFDLGPTALVPTAPTNLTANIQ